MSKQVQIPVTLLIDVYKLIIALEDEILVTGSGEIAERIRTQILSDNIKITWNCQKKE